MIKKIRQRNFITKIISSKKSVLYLTKVVSVLATSRSSLAAYSAYTHQDKTNGINDILSDESSPLEQSKIIPV